jgi:hypothetical protein
VRAAGLGVDEARGVQLEQALRLVDVLEPMRAEVAERDVGERVVAEQGARGLRDEHLPSHGRGSDSRRPVHAEPDVAVLAVRRLAGMDAHPDAQLSAVGPFVLRERSLAVDGCGYGVLGAPEGDEERIALRVDLVAPMGLERLTEESLVLCQRLPVVPAEPLQQARRPLDVREEEGDGSGGPLAGRCHSRGVLLRAICV